MSAWVDELDFSQEPPSREWVAECRRARRLWDAQDNGDTYELQVVNRTTGHRFRVHQRAHSIFQAGLRYYRGLEGGTIIWQCTRVLGIRLL